MKLPSAPEIKAFFPEFRAPVVRNFLLLIYCIFSSRSLCLYKCAEYVPISALFASNYQRLLRFVRTKHAELFCLGVSRLLLSLAAQSGPCYLVIDRTNWRLGSRPINVLCLGLLVGERFYVPLVWELLPKHGSSNTTERIELMKRLLVLLDDPKRYVLLADREFVGKQWVHWLRNRGIKLVIRLREGDYLNDLSASSKQVYTLKKISRHVHRRGRFSAAIKLEGYRLYYIGLIDQTIGGDVVYLLSSEADPRWAQQAYARRWSIEVFFKQLKSDGFNFETTRLYDRDRLRMLIAAASVAYLFALEEGLWEAKKRPIKIKRSPGLGMRWPEVSVVRYGLRVIARKMQSFRQLLRGIKRLFLRKRRQSNLDQLYLDIESV